MYAPYFIYIWVKNNFENKLFIALEKVAMDNFCVEKSRYCSIRHDEKY